MKFSNFFSGLFLATILVVSSCEVETGGTELYFKGEFNDVEFDVLDGSRYYSNAGGGYTITSKLNDTADLYITVPSLDPATYTLAKDSTDASVFLWVKKGEDQDMYSTGLAGSETYYTITIDSYEKGPGTLQGTFEAKVTDIVSAIFGGGQYHTISNGQFSINSSN